MRVNILSAILLLFFNFSCRSSQNLFAESYLDTDLDGVPDERDACPTVYGSPFNFGCPSDSELSAQYDAKLSTDADLDGVPDDKDECPNEYGSPFNMGCP